MDEVIQQITLLALVEVRRLQENGMVLETLTLLTTLCLQSC